MMSKGLSFLFQGLDAGAHKLAEGLSSGAAKAPDILHYLWLVEVPGLPAPPGFKNFLLTTVYDESFEAYISDLVKADTHGFFDAAARAINGLEKMVPVKDHLSDFINFVAKHDLTQTHSAGPGFVQFYPWTVALIHEKLGPKPPAHAGAKPQAAPLQR
jgi:hypothetical protein